MIQELLDFAAQLIAGLLAGLPDLPAEFVSSLSGISSAGVYLGTVLTNLGAIVPWTIIFNVVQWWLGAFAFWGAMLLLRLVLWAFNR